MDAVPIPTDVKILTPKEKNERAQRDVDEIIWMVESLSKDNKQQLLEKFAQNYPQLPKPLTQESLQTYIKQHYGDQDNFLTQIKEQLGDVTHSQMEEALANSQTAKGKELLWLAALSLIAMFVSTRLLWGSAAASAAGIQLPWWEPPVI